MSTIERWNPFRELQEVFDRPSRMQRFFEEFGDPDFWPIKNGLAVDLVENEKNYELRASMPGYKPEDIHLEINQDTVTMRGEMKEEKHEEKKDNYLYHERRSGSFFRQFRLPSTVDSSKAVAELKDGVLTLTLPKTELVTSHKIEVKGAK